MAFLPKRAVVTITATFSHNVENYQGDVGKSTGRTTDGLTMDDLRGIQAVHGGELVDLHALIPDDVEEKKTTEEAGLLIIPNFVSRADADAILEELEKLEYDTKAWSARLGVHERKARQNLCLTEETKKGDVEKKEGSTVSFSDLPCMAALRKRVEGLHPSLAGVFAELNRYHRKGAGIGFHGDKERKEVIAFRLGRARCLKYAWFGRYPDAEGVKHTGRISPMWSRMLEHGTLYIMSRKAVGTDWSKTKDEKNNCPLLTLRHAAGDDEYAGDSKTKALNLKGGVANPPLKTLKRKRV